LTYAFFNKSGGRYIQVIDWVTSFYFILGLNWLLLEFVSQRINDHTVYSYLIQILESHHEDDQGSSQQPRWRGAVWAIPLFVLGISMPIVERRIPEKYTDLTLAGQLINISQSVDETVDDIDSSELTALYGKALYPGYFAAGEKLTDDRQGNLPADDQSRLVFYLIGTDNIWVSIPMNESPVYFPHGSDVIVLGKITRDSEEYLKMKLKPYFLADQVFILDAGEGQSDIVKIECDISPCLP
jgi:hypothetical protein